MPVVVGCDARDRETTVVGLRFGRADDHPHWLAGARRDDELLRPAIEQLHAYAAGTLTSFALPLHLSGTPFQVAVWSALLEIPYGITSTYGRVAEAVGRPPSASRAVGSAVGSNPIGIMVPCHRVIGANGSLTGFGGGLDNKVALLTREGVGAL
ncbi:MAG: methylated-DNA--[protein]-cysteine S-methyltransferase [Acidimicrobiales bacterium]|nr:methylated-DNA--[protein]-cysteine S-methyltransferase [Acidimicrobiales bacterium]